MDGLIRVKVKIKVRVGRNDVKETTKTLPERFTITAAARQFIEMYKKQFPDHEVWMTGV